MLDNISYHSNHRLDDYSSVLSHLDDFGSYC